MRGVVWMASWQIQCCGEPFRVGARVAWHLTQPDNEGLKTALGAEAETITHSEDHHSELTAPPKTTAVVSSIRAAYYRMAPRPGENPRFHHAVAGSAVFKPVVEADGWEPEEGGLSFAGYLVEVDLIA